MKLGYCVNMLGTERDPIGREYIKLLKPAGYDYVELPLAQVMDLSEGEFDALLEELDRRKLPCLCCNNFFPASVRLTGEEREEKRIREYVERAVGRASDLGAGRIVFGSSGAKNVPEGFDPRRAFEQVVETLRLAAQYVEPAGIRIAIEPLNRAESNLILNLTEGQALVRAVNHPSVRLLVDYYHFVMEEERLETLREAMPEICHVHFAAPQGRRIPLEAAPEYRGFFRTLREGGYDGTLSVEAYSSCPEREIPRAVVLRDYFE